jgi:hypothetical protein
MNAPTAPKTFPRLDTSLLAHLRPFSKRQARQIRTILYQTTSARFEAGVAMFDEGAAAEWFQMLPDGYVLARRVKVTGEQATALHVRRDS